MRGMVVLLCINSVVSFKNNKNVVVGVETDINGNIEKYLIEDRFTANRNYVTEEEVIPWAKSKYEVKKKFNSK